jgi:hypothetical protein
LWPQPGAHKKTHSRFQPWVYVESAITFDKRLRRRHILRRRAADQQLVEYQTFDCIVVLGGAGSSSSFKFFLPKFFPPGIIFKRLER